MVRRRETQREGGETQREGAAVAPFPQQAEEAEGKNCSRTPRGTPSLTPERGAPGVPLRARGPQVSDAVSPPPRHRATCRASPRPAASILVRCRSAPPGKRLPMPGGRRHTQARCAARGSPGERGAGSILPEPRPPRQRRGRRRRAQTRLLPPPPLTCCLPGPPPPPGRPPRVARAPASRLPLPRPPGPWPRLPSALRQLSRAAVATRRSEGEPARERGRRAPSPPLRGPGAPAASRLGGGAPSRGPPAGRG